MLELLENVFLDVLKNSLLFKFPVTALDVNLESLLVWRIKAYEC